MIDTFLKQKFVWIHTVAKGRAYNLKTGSKAYWSRMCRPRILVKFWESLHLSTAMKGNPKRYRRWEEGLTRPPYPLGYGSDAMSSQGWSVCLGRNMVVVSQKCNGYGIGRYRWSTDNFVFLNDDLGGGRAWWLERTKPRFM